MRKFLIPIVSILIFQLTLPAYALLGVGDVVSDPGSYSYYVQQIEQAAQQLQQLKDQLKEIQEAKQVAMDTAESVKGVYYHAKGTVAWFEDLADELKNRPLDTVERVTGIDMEEEARSFSTIFEDNYSDVRYNNVDWLRDLGKFDLANKSEKQRQKIKELIHQEALKNELDTADKILDDLPAEFKNIKTLAYKIDTTQNMKSSQDLTNTLLAQMSSIMIKMLDLMAKTAKAEGIILYGGFNAEELTALIKEQMDMNEKMAKRQKPYDNSTGFETWPEMSKHLNGKETDLSDFTIKF